MRVLGVDDQLKALKAEITVAANIPGKRRSSLLLKLALADRHFSSANATMATVELGSFMKAVRLTPRLTEAQRARWTRAAIRISAVIG